MMTDADVDALPVHLVLPADVIAMADATTDGIGGTTDAMTVGIGGMIAEICVIITNPLIDGSCFGGSPLVY